MLAASLVSTIVDPQTSVRQNDKSSQINVGGVWYNTLREAWWNDVEILISIGYSLKQIRFLCPEPPGNFYGSRPFILDVVKELMENFEKLQNEKNKTLVKEMRVSRLEARKMNEHMKLQVESFEEVNGSNVCDRKYVFDATCHPSSKKPFYEFKNNISECCKGELLRLKNLFPYVCNGKFDIVVLRDAFVQFNQFMFTRGWFLHPLKLKCSEEKASAKLVMCIFYDKLPPYLHKDFSRQPSKESTTRSSAKFLEEYVLLARIFGGKCMNKSYFYNRVVMANKPEFYSQYMHSEWKMNPRKMKKNEEEFSELPDLHLIRKKRDNPRRVKKEFRSKDSQKQPRGEKNEDPSEDVIEGQMLEKAYEQRPRWSHFFGPFLREQEMMASTFKNSRAFLEWSGRRQLDYYREYKAACKHFDLIISKMEDSNSYTPHLPGGLKKVRPDWQDFKGDVKTEHESIRGNFSTSKKWKEAYWGIWEKHWEKFVKQMEDYNSSFVPHMMPSNLGKGEDARFDYSKVRQRPHLPESEQPDGFMGSNKLPHNVVARAVECAGWEAEQAIYRAGPMLAKDLCEALAEMFTGSVKDIFSSIPATVSGLVDAVVDLFNSDFVSDVVKFLIDAYHKLVEKVSQVWSSMTGDNADPKNLMPHILCWLLIGIVLGILIKIYNISAALVSIAFSKFVETMIGWRYCIDASYGFDCLLKGLTADALWNDLDYRTMDETKEVKISGQMFGLGMTGMVGVVALVLAILDPKGLTSANGVMNLITRSGPLLENVTDALSVAIDDLWIRLGGKDHLFQSRAEVDSYMTFIKDMQTFAATENLRELCLKDKVKTLELEGLIRRGDAIKVVLKDNSSPLLGSFSQTFAFLRNLHNECLANADMYQSRIETVCLWFYGLPGTGKTKSLDLIPMDVYKDLEEALRGEDGKSELTPWTPGQRYTRVKGSDYWDGYYGQWCVALPEIMTAAKSEDIGKELTEILGMCEDNVFALNVAFTDKGKVFFRSDLLTITTNQDFVNFLETSPGETGIRNNDAVLRRRTFPMKVLKNSDMESDYSNINETWTFRVEYPGHQMYRDAFFLGLSRFLELSPPRGGLRQGKNYNAFVQQKFWDFTYQELKIAIGLEILHRRMRPKDSHAFQDFRVPVNLKEISLMNRVYERRELTEEEKRLKVILSKDNFSHAKFNESCKGFDSMEVDTPDAFSHFSDTVSMMDTEESPGEEIDQDFYEGHMLKAISESLFGDKKEIPRADHKVGGSPSQVAAWREAQKKEKENKEEEEKKLQLRLKDQESSLFAKRTEPIWKGLFTTPRDLELVKDKVPVDSLLKVDATAEEINLVTEVYLKSEEYMKEEVLMSVFDLLYLREFKEDKRMDRPFYIYYQGGFCSTQKTLGFYEYCDTYFACATYDKVRSFGRGLKKFLEYGIKNHSVRPNLEDKKSLVRKWFSLAGFTGDVLEHVKAVPFVDGKFDPESMQHMYYDQTGYVPSGLSVTVMAWIAGFLRGSPIMFDPDTMDYYLTRGMHDLSFRSPKIVKSGPYYIVRQMIKLLDPEYASTMKMNTDNMKPVEKEKFGASFERSFLESIAGLKDCMKDFPIFGYVLIGSVVVGALTTVIWTTFSDDEPEKTDDYLGSIEGEMYSSYHAYQSESLTKRDPFKVGKYTSQSYTKKDPMKTTKYASQAGERKPNVGNPHQPDDNIIGHHFQITGDDAIIQANARVTKCIRNIQDVRFIYEGLPPLASKLFCLEGNCYMQTAHWFEAYGTAFLRVEFLGIGGVVTSTHSANDIKLVSLNNYESCDLPNKSVVFEFGKRDAFLMYVKSGTARASLYNNMYDHKKSMPDKGVTKIKPVIMKNVTHIYMPYTKEMYVTKNRTTPITTVFDNGKSLGFTHCGTVMGCKGAPGDCTLPYLDIYEVNSTAWFLGCHVGAGAAHGYFAPMYKEDLSFTYDWKMRRFVARTLCDMTDDSYKGHSYQAPLDVYYPAEAQDRYLFNGSISVPHNEEVEEDASILPKHNHDNVVGTYYFGSSKRSNFIPHETQFVPSLFQGTDLGDGLSDVHFSSNQDLDTNKPIFPVKTAPAMLSAFLREDEDGVERVVSPLKLAQDKIGAVNKSQPIPDFVKYLAENEPLFLADGFLPGPHVPKPKFVKQTPYEACFGVAGIFSSVDISTAAGFWLWCNFLTRKDVIDKDRINSDGTKGWISPKLLLEIARIELAVKQGRIPKLCTLGCLKDELRDLDRVSQGKTRLFHVGDFAHMIWTKMVIGHAVEWIKANRFETCGAIGTNPHGPDWAHWKRILETAEEELIFGGGDFSGYDTGVRQFFGEALGRLMNELYQYSVGSFHHRELIYCCIATTGPLMVIGRNAYWMDYMNPSGGWATGFLNTYVNSCLMKIVFLILIRECSDSGCTCGLSLERDNYAKVVRKILYGDDNVWSVYKKYSKHWNMLNVSRIIRDYFGMIYTRPDKTEIGDRGEIPLDEVDFLCRKFAGSSSFCRAPLAKESIEGMLLWTRNAGDGTPDCLENRKQLEENIDVAHMEMYYYGLDAFVDFADRVQKYCRAYNVTNTAQTFEAYQLRHTTSYQ